MVLLIPRWIHMSSLKLQPNNLPPMYLPALQTNHLSSMALLHKRLPQLHRAVLSASARIFPRMSNLLLVMPCIHLVILRPIMHCTIWQVFCKIRAWCDNSCIPAAMHWLRPLTLLRLCRTYLSLMVSWRNILVTIASKIEAALRHLKLIPYLGCQ